MRRQLFLSLQRVTFLRTLQGARNLEAAGAGCRASEEGSWDVHAVPPWARGLSGSRPAPASRAKPRRRAPRPPTLPSAAAPVKPAPARRPPSRQQDGGITGARPPAHSAPAPPRRPSPEEVSAATRRVEAVLEGLGLRLAACAADPERQHGLLLAALGDAERAGSGLAPAHLHVLLSVGLCRLAQRCSGELDVHSVARPYLDMYMQALAGARRGGGPRAAPPGPGLGLDSLTRLWEALAACSHPVSHRMLDRLARQTLALLVTAGTPDAARALACAARYAYDPLHGRLTQALTAHLGAAPLASFTPQSVHAVLGAGARAGKPLDPGLVEHAALATLYQLRHHAVGLLDLGRSWNLLLRHDPDPLQGRLARAAAAEVWRQLPDASCEALGEALSALHATRQRMGVPTLEATAARLQELDPARCPPDDLARCLWAYGKLRWHLAPSSTRQARLLNHLAARPGESVDVRGFVHAPPLSTGTQGGQLQALAQHAQHVHDDDGTPDAFLGGRLHKNDVLPWGMSRDTPLPSGRTLGQLDGDEVRAFLQRTHDLRVRQVAKVAGDTVRAAEEIIAAVRRKYKLKKGGPAAVPASSEPSAPETLILEDSVWALANAIGSAARRQGQLPPRVERVSHDESWPSRTVVDPVTGITSTVPHYTPAMLEYREDWVRPAWLDERLPPGSAPRDPWNPGAGREEGQGSSPSQQERLPQLLEVETGEGPAGDEGDGAELSADSATEGESPPGLLGAAAAEDDDEEEEEEEDEEEEEEEVVEDRTAASGRRGVPTAPDTGREAAQPSKAPGPGAAPRSAAWRLNAAQELVTQHDLDRVANEVWVRWLRAPRASLQACFQSVTQQRANLSWKGIMHALEAMSMHFVVDRPLLASIQGRILEDLGSVGNNTIIRYLVTCAALQESPGKPFLDAVAEEVLGRLERRQASHSHLIMVAWAMATLGQLSAARFAEFLRAAPAATEPSHVGNHGRLLQIALYLQMETGKHYSTFLPAEILAVVEERAREDQPTVSYLQQDILSALNTLGLEFEMEARAVNGLLSVDFALQGEHTSRKIAVEADGPLHFAPTPPYQPLSHTLFRDRLLEYNGWTVVSVPFYEWNRLRSLTQKQAYLREKLAPAVEAG